MIKKLAQELKAVLAEHNIDTNVVDIKMNAPEVDEVPKDLYDQDFKKLREDTEEERIEEITEDKTPKDIHEMLNHEKETELTKDDYHT